MLVNHLAKNNLINVTAINQKFSNETKQNVTENSKFIMKNKDVLSLSKQGERGSLLNSLMRQKKFIQESKDALLKDGLENGNVDKHKLEEYDEQLKMIEQQILETMVKESVKDDKDENQHNKIMTEEEYDRKKMCDMMTLSDNLTQAKTINSVRKKVDGEINVLKAEIKLDGEYVLESKLKKVAVLEQHSSKLSNQLSDKLTETGDALLSNNENIEIKDNSEENNNTELLTDDNNS